MLTPVEFGKLTEGMRRQRANPSINSFQPVVPAGIRGPAQALQRQSQMQAPAQVANPRPTEPMYQTQPMQKPVTQMAQPNWGQTIDRRKRDMPISNPVTQGFFPEPGQVVRQDARYAPKDEFFQTQPIQKGGMGDPRQALVQLMMQLRNQGA
jgi:hypothetical protein